MITWLGTQSICLIYSRDWSIHKNKIKNYSQVLQLLSIHPTKISTFRIAIVCAMLQRGPEMGEMCSLNWITSNYMQLAHSPSTVSSSHFTTRLVMDPPLVPKPCSTADM